jgi:hypothetical protein
MYNPNNFSLSSTNKAVLPPTLLVILIAIINLLLSKQQGSL